MRATATLCHSMLAVVDIVLAFRRWTVSMGVVCKDHGGCAGLVDNY